MAYIILASVTAVLMVAWTTGPFYFHFADTRLINVYSYIQLFGTAIVAFLPCRLLCKGRASDYIKDPSARPFFLSAIGFLYLGLDDLLSIHEGIDKLIHLLIGMKETALSDHIDDVILLLYGIIALFFIRDFIREFKKHSAMAGLIAAGVAAFFVMFVLDFASNNAETFVYLFNRVFTGDILHAKDVCKMVEESVELFGEAFFFAAFAAAYTDIRLKMSKSI